MKNSHVAAIVGGAIGAFLIWFAFNSGERVIVGEMEDMRPIFGHVLNKPMLAAGIALVVASLVVFGLSFRSSPAGAGRSDLPAESHAPPPPRDAEEPSSTETTNAPETETSGG